MVRLPQGVANRDVKLENTLLVSTARPLIKLCDFGYSKVIPPRFCFCFQCQTKRDRRRGLPRGCFRLLPLYVC